MSCGGMTFDQHVPGAASGATFMSMSMLWIHLVHVGFLVEFRRRGSRLSNDAGCIVGYG